VQGVDFLGADRADFAGGPVREIGLGHAAIVAPAPLCRGDLGIFGDQLGDGRRGALGLALAKGIGAGVYLAPQLGRTLAGLCRVPCRERADCNAAFAPASGDVV
jgi:hypothetical protein